jgi:biopolymer transport protein ExbB
MSRHRRMVTLCALLIACASPGVRAQDAPEDSALQQAIDRTAADVRQARDALAARREQIARQRQELAQEVAEQAAQIERLRRELVALRDAEQQQAAAQRELQNQLDRSTRLWQRFAGVLTEWRRAGEAMLPGADAAAVAEDLAQVDAALDRAGKEPETLLPATATMGRVLLDHLTSAAGVTCRSGEAVAPDGLVLEGTEIRIGGVTRLFVPDEAQAAPGLLGRDRGGRGHLVPADDAASPLQKLARGRTATVPVDITGGVALRSASKQKSLTEFIRAGGVVAVPILLVGLLCLVVGGVKLVHLAMVRGDARQPLMALLQDIRNGELAAAQARVDRAHPPLKAVAAEALQHHAAPREHLEELLHEAILAQSPRLERYLSVLSVGAAVAPLLGLLGTVTGMINTFTLISVHGAGDARLLSGGISEALITTELGLMVAIPALLMHAFLSRRVRRILEDLENSALAFVNGLKVRDVQETKEQQAVEAKAGGAEA